MSVVRPLHGPTCHSPPPPHTYTHALAYNSLSLTRARARTHSERARRCTPPHPLSNAQPEFCTHTIRTRTHGQSFVDAQRDAGCRRDAQGLAAMGCAQLGRVRRSWGDAKKLGFAGLFLLVFPCDCAALGEQTRSANMLCVCTDGSVSVSLDARACQTEMSRTFFQDGVCRADVGCVPSLMSGHLLISRCHWYDQM